MSTRSEESERLSTEPFSHKVAIEWDRREPVSYTVQVALSDVVECEPTELDPLADYVDPDALEAFFSGQEGDRSARSVTFEYDGYTVRIEGDGQVLVD
jgi:hypothetical protein